MKEKLDKENHDKAIDYAPKRYNPIGTEEINAVNEVLNTGILSDFIGAPGEKFIGGEQVLKFEQKIKDYYDVKYAISVNSLTSGLICAVGAIGIEPGDEIIVSPWTMCASATAILMWNAIPVFADIEESTFNISPASILEKISDRTRAIVVPSIFGLPADFDEILKIAKAHDLRVIEDAAQVPGVKLNGKYVGTYGDIGGYSFNYHKHIHCGEGGVCVTNDDALAEKMRLIRNHAEAVVDSDSPENLVNMLGFNFRLGEIEAAIASKQMEKLDELVLARQHQGEQLNEGLRSLNDLCVPEKPQNANHAYYMYGLRYVGSKSHRDVIVKALRDEGVPGVCDRYVNVHLYPLYQQKIAYGTSGFPWSLTENAKKMDYGKGLCPVAERLNDKEYIGLSLCQFELDSKNIEDIINAFRKVWDKLKL